ncbi:YqcC family protein [Microbulbifer thermotolerans]|uniref:Pseudouridine synthase n=1 Tax=Microbulbifer thermotolerans TaxID=252514 RepID=A0A143HN25_MICTH|nr:YqcC family protein [Microbulbifer thermotolerans]AMX03108.1 pseudouridine synthase [Microbulbifer thermotolerans]MCX2779076.1 YqcC family protein [Microbulbifer thermotolerans]MCX2784347.1 YqcC family protein [Microbulbifer thermotolerans]MCX2796021.1 YqcC family protein [Microbulbifer thermotolerans]MCX2801910.1 YqcC family protein [Microbulbifer thermotolerans]
MERIYSEVAEQLLLIEAEMRRLDLWAAQPPSAEALASTEPFCVDTLTLPQWLQFIFLPRMRQLIERELPLPRQCGIAPMAEEYFRGDAGGKLVERLAELDGRLQRG